MPRSGQSWVYAACFVIALAATAFADSAATQSVDYVPAGPPSWAADAIWYQVFVSRFANGEPGNDPVGTLPWDTDWAKRRPDEDKPLGIHLHFRRYGGDLLGLRQKLPYLIDLGVNALYLNPVFQADSEHKYDTADYRHIDDSFGVADSRLALADETEDPKTWGWSASDREFLALLANAHARGLRVIIDVPFNHVGQSFWAWQDVKKHGQESAYSAWFDVLNWGPPLRWNAWDGPNGNLVRFRRSGDGLHPDVEQHIFAITRRWMDPDGDGDPSDGIDGWRLDAAEQVPHGFWRRFRRVVKSVNPEAFILGEIWVNHAPWLDGEQFDACTNYPFSWAVVDFVRGNAGDATTAFADQFDRLSRREPLSAILAMADLLDSHDTERIATMLLGEGVLSDATTDDPNRRDLLRPDNTAYRHQRLAAFVQFTAPGAPMVFYGDEVGMYGGDDPFCRAPMWWPESAAEGYRADLHSSYRFLCHARQRLPALRRGAFRLVMADNARQLVAFCRWTKDQVVFVLVNGDEHTHVAELNIGAGSQIVSILRGASDLDGDPVPPPAVGPDGLVSIECSGLSGALIIVRPALERLSATE